MSSTWFQLMDRMDALEERLDKLEKIMVHLHRRTLGAISVTAPQPESLPTMVQVPDLATGQVHDTGV